MHVVDGPDLLAEHCTRRSVRETDSELGAVLAVGKPFGEQTHKALATQVAVDRGREFTCAEDQVVDEPKRADHDAQSVLEGEHYLTLQTARLETCTSRSTPLPANAQR